MSFYTRLVSSALFPLHERVKGHASVELRRELERTQWLGHEQILRMQGERLRAFLVEIGGRVPYYRDLFARVHFDPREASSRADLARLPLLDKAAIRAAGEAMLATDAGALTRYNTGGSSGEPLVFYIGKDRKTHDVAAKWRATRWWGVDIGDPEIVVWGSPIELRAQDWMRLSRDRVLRSTLLPAFEMSPANLDRFVDEIARIRPAMLFGYPSSLALIAEHAKVRGVDLSQLGVKVAFVTSERLYEHQREAISAAFGCPVANGYGGRDAGFIAHECPHGGMHLSAEHIVVEIVDGDGQPAAPGAAGEIVVTHMATADFPFVRYRTGDIGVLDEAPCPCGRGLPLLEEIQGRSTDFVVAQDGTVLHGLALIYTVRDMPGVERFRIVQHARDNVEVLLVANTAFGDADERRIRESFRGRLGADVRVDITKVPDIAPERSGKYRYVVSHVAAGPGTR
ncbi:MAG: phenylacetate--CoA ligase family protein [Burkholderiales bacterium]|nr:phenylacetate--CoA ligase family protein [Burkholderiales bacterium]